MLRLDQCVTLSVANFVRFKSKSNYFYLAYFTSIRQARFIVLKQKSNV